MVAICNAIYWRAFLHLRFAGHASGTTMLLLHKTPIEGVYLQDPSICAMNSVWKDDRDAGSVSLPNNTILRPHIPILSCLCLSCQTPCAINHFSIEYVSDFNLGTGGCQVWSQLGVLPVGIAQPPEWLQRTTGARSRTSSLCNVAAARCRGRTAGSPSRRSAGRV